MSNDLTVTNDIDFNQQVEKYKGYNGSVTLKRAGVEINWTSEMVQEYIKCKNDIIYFAEKYFKIIGEDGLKNIKLRGFQKEFIEAMQNNRFVISCCGRQQGKCSTFNSIISVGGSQVKIGNKARLSFKFNIINMLENALIWLSRS